MAFIKKTSLLIEFGRKFLIDRHKNDPYHEHNFMRL